MLCSPASDSGRVKLGNFMLQTCNDGSEMYKKESCTCKVFLANINLFLFAVLLSSLSLWSKNFATMVTWHHTSPLHTHCEPLLRRECHHEFWQARAPGGQVLLMPLESKAWSLGQMRKRSYGHKKPNASCGGGGGATHQSFIQGGFPVRSNPLTFYKW